MRASPTCAAGDDVHLALAARGVQGPTAITLEQFFADDLFDDRQVVGVHLYMLQFVGEHFAIGT